MRSSTKWISAFLLGMMMSPACRHSGEPPKSGTGVTQDAGTDSDPPSEHPGIEPDTGAPIGPVANPRLSQYQDGLFSAAPIAGGGSGAIGGVGPGGGSGGNGGSGLVPAPRYIVAL